VKRSTAFLSSYISNVRLGYYRPLHTNRFEKIKNQWTTILKRNASNGNISFSEDLQVRTINNSILLVDAVDIFPEKSIK